VLKEIVIAIQSYFKAHELIKKHKLWKWILIPGIVYAILFVISMYFFGQSASQFIEFLSLKTGLKQWLDGMQSGLLGVLFTLAGLILWLILMLFYFSLFKYVWLIVGSPLFAYLSEKTEMIITGKEFPFSAKQLFADAIRGMGIALRNSLWQIVYLIAILFLSLIPLAGWITPLIALMIECYYYGSSMLDYSCERRKMTMQESLFFINHHRGLAIGNGIVFYAMHLIPIIGWVLAPAYAVIAATLSMIETKNEIVPNER
jgi:CysZ protein